MIRSKRRWNYRAFIAVATGMIAQHVMQRQSFNVFMSSKKKEFAGEGVPLGELVWSLSQKMSVIETVNWRQNFTALRNISK